MPEPPDRDGRAFLLSLSCLRQQFGFLLEGMSKLHFGHEDGGHGFQDPNAELYRIHFDRTARQFVGVICVVLVPCDSSCSSSALFLPRLYQQRYCFVFHRRTRLTLQRLL